MPDGRNLSTAILGSRFGRRLFVMFCLAALLPAIVVFWMTWRTATHDAVDARHEALREGGKNFAMGVFDRLQLADGALAMADVETIASGGRDPHLELYFSDVRMDDQPLVDAEPDAGTGAAPAPVAGGIPSRLRIPPEAGASPQLLRRDGDRMLVASLDPDYLWGRQEDMGQGMRLCMFAGRPLFCGGHPGTEPGEELLAAPWELFLKPSFGAEPWTVVAVAGAGHGLAHYRGVLVPSAIAVLLLALLLSSVQIRRVLVPLSDLLRRIHGFAGRDTMLARESGEDEFGLLSRTFGRMQHRIGRQMDMLRMLSEVDRLILRGASLTSLVELVAGRIRDLSGCAVVYVRTPASQAGGEQLLFVLGRDAATVKVLQEDRPGSREDLSSDATSTIEPPATGGDGGSGAWRPVDALPTGTLREALQRDGVRMVATLAPGEPGARGTPSGGVQVLLGFDAPPEQGDGALEEAAKLADAIPVAVAFDAGRQQLVHQARHDLLTGLPNRLATFEAVGAAVDAARAGGTRFAVAFVDLDRFKPVNDGLGHASGDQLLVAVARRIRESLAPGDLVGRFGGDEFCVVLPDARDEAAATAAIDRVAVGLSRPVRAAGREFVQGFSAGIALFPDHGHDAGSLIRNADMAMYAGKRAGGRAVRVFTPAMDSDARSRVQLEQDLRAAIAAGTIDVHYQPRIDSRDGRMVGVEALARWMHPQSGPVPPSIFIPLAEDTGLIDDLGALILHRACAQLAAWRAAGLVLPLVAVNVSSRQLRSRRLPDTVRAALVATGLEPSGLEIEITETMLMQAHDAGDTQLRELRDLGVGIAIDDFGTGYSSLSYLAGLPFDTLKIDRSFVLGMGDGSTPMAAVIRLVVRLAGELGKSVIAEGVESLQDVEVLAGMGCHWIQGHAYHRALPAEGVTRLLELGDHGDPRTPLASG